jgi:hypothetical protein
MKARRRSVGSIWGGPAMMAALIVFGLSSALLGQGGVWWALSWVALTIPLIVIATCVYKRRGPEKAE